jgi:hypothetical protein
LNAYLLMTQGKRLCARQEKVQFYPVPMSQNQHLLFLAMAIIIVIIHVLSARFNFDALAFPLILIWVCYHLRSRYPCIAIDQEGISVKELLGIFCERTYRWSELTGKPVRVKQRLELTPRDPRLGPRRIWIFLEALSKEDRLRLTELVGKSIRAEDEQHGEPGFRCFQCGNLIEVHENACSQCGWTWK